MVIQEMTLEQCEDLLAKTGLARLACEMDGQPYVVPVYIAYDGTYLFGFATMGYKIDCMRSNPLVCVEIDDIKSHNHWMTVVIFGRYEELPDVPEHAAAREHAYKLLQTRAMWWEPAYVAVEHRDHTSSISPVFYRIHIDRMTGHRASPDEVDLKQAKRSETANWLRRSLDWVIPRSITRRGVNGH